MTMESRPRLCCENVWCEHLWPFGEWNLDEIYFHDFRILDLPKVVLEVMARMLTNYDRRRVGQTCSSLRRLFEESTSHRQRVSPALDRRHLCEIYVYYEPGQPPSEPPISFYAHFPEWPRISEYSGMREISKHIYGGDYMDQCGALLKRYTEEYALESVEWSMYTPDDDGIISDQLFRFVPREACGNLRMIVFGISAALHENSVKLVARFLSTSHFTRLSFSILRTFSEAYWKVYVEMVTSWCIRNGWAIAEGKAHLATGFCKRTINGVSVIVRGVKVNKDSAEWDQNVADGINLDDRDEEWCTGPVNLL